MYLLKCYRSIHFADADNLVESSEPLENSTENVRNTTINVNILIILILLYLDYEI